MRAAPWKVGIVGCGKIAGSRDYPRPAGSVETYAQALRRHPEFHLAAVTDPGREPLEQFQRTWEVARGYRSLEEMLEEEHLDVIILCSPSEFHFSQAMQILGSSAKPRVLFIEKPVCQKEAELSTLIDLAKRTGIGVGVNHTRRFDPAHRWLAQQVRSGAFGPLVEGKITSYGGWLNNGTHLVDLIRLLFPKEPQVIWASFLESGRRGDRDLAVQLKVVDSMVRIDGFDEKNYQILESDFRFRAGRVQLLEAGARILVEGVTVNRLQEQVLVPRDGSPREGMVSVLGHAVEAIASSLKGERAFESLGVDLESVSLTMEVVWAALEKAAREQDSEWMVRDVVRG